MPALLNRGIHRLRGGITNTSDAAAVNAHLSENKGDGQASIVLLDLGGLEYRSLKDIGNDTASKKMGFSRSLRRLGGKPAISDMDEVENTDDVATASSAPTKIVVWCQQKESKNSSEHMPEYLSSCALGEESMDDEGNVVSWGCTWPGETGLLNLPLPMAHKREKKSTVQLGVGIQVPGQDGIQPLGVATVTVPEEDKATFFLSIPVEPMKKKNRLFGKLGTKQSPPKDCEYIISPSVVLNVKLRVTSELSFSRRIVGTLLDENFTSSEHVTKSSQASLADSIETEATSIASESATQLFGLNFPTAFPKHTAVSVEGSKMSKTVKAANTAATSSPPPRLTASLVTVESRNPSEASDLSTIESEGSVIEYMAKKRDVVVPFGEELTESKSHLPDVEIRPSGELMMIMVRQVNDKPIEDSAVEKSPSEMALLQEISGDIHQVGISIEGGMPTVENDIKNAQFEEKCNHQQLGQYGQDGNLDDKQLLAEDAKPIVENGIKNVQERGQRSTKQPAQLDQAQMQETVDHKPLLAFVEMKETNSDVGNEDLTIGSFELAPNNYEILKRMACGEVNGCVSNIEAVFDDAVEGFSDIVHCG